MRRRKKDKTKDKVPTNSTEHDTLDSSGRGGSSGSKSSKDDASNSGVTVTVSPPQQRKRSLLGSLGSMRDLVEQVQDSLSKTKQDPSSSSGGGKDKDKDKDGSNAPMSGSSSTHSSAEKPSSSRIASILSGNSNHGGSSHNKASSLFGPLLDMKSSNKDKDKDKDKDASGSAPGSPASLAAAAVGATAAADVRALAIVGNNGASSKKKMLDLKLLQSGTSLAVRLKKQVPLTPSPSEFKARERQDLADQPFCGVCAAPFTLMVRRQRCAVCGESVCAQCSSDKRHVEGQKGLQRVCDICIVEGPVVLDENGLYSAGPSPAATPVDTMAVTTVTPVPTAPPALAPPSSAERPVVAAIKAAATASSSAGTKKASSSSSTKSAAAAAAAAVRSLFADSPPTSSAAGKSSGKSSGKSYAAAAATAATAAATAATAPAPPPPTKTPRTPKTPTDIVGNPKGDDGGPSQSVVSSRPPRSPTTTTVKPPRSPAAAAAAVAAAGIAGKHQPTSPAAETTFKPPRSPVTVTTVVKGTGAHSTVNSASGGGGGGGGTAKDYFSKAAAAMELEEDKPATAVAKPKPSAVQGATLDQDTARPAALGDEDYGEAESGPPSSVSHSSKGRKRGKKARRAGAAADAKASSSSQDRRQHSWSGQSFSDCGGGVGHNPGTRSTRSTPRGNNGSGSGFSNQGNPTYVSGAGGASTATPRGGNGGGTKGKWESTSLRKQRRSSSTSDGGLEAVNDEDGGGIKQGRQSEGALWRQQSSSFVRDFIRGAGIHRLDPRRLTGPLTMVVSRTGLDRAWAGAWVLLRRFLEYLLEITQEHERGRTGGGRARRSGGGGRVGNGHYHHHVGAAGWQQRQRQRWMPGRRVAAVAFLTLLASYRRYQVTHPEVTTEHVLGGASSLVFALAAFLVHAAADLTIDACGAVIPSLCGTREARLAAAYGRLQAGVTGGGGVGSGGDGGGDGAGVGRRIGQEGGPRVLGEEGADGAPGEGHELDQYFVL